MNLSNFFSKLKHMQFKYSCLLILLSSFMDSFVTAQVSPATGGAFEFSQSAACLSENDRKALKHKLTAQVRKMEKDGKLYKSLSSSMVSLESPIRKAATQSNMHFYTIRNYVDHDPSATGSQFGSSNLDYNCGVRTYDNTAGYNHRGTDYCSWPFPWHAYENDLMEVVAAAAGQIIGIDDNNKDDNCDCINNFDSWNAIYIRHADGSVAWYGHLKKGIEKVVGQMVQQGDYLGVVGSSGCSTDPHLHFEVYDAAGNLIDPYQGSCNSMNNQTWWAAQEDYYVPRINALRTHFQPPVFGCPAVNEATHFSDCFHPGDRIYVAVYLRDQLDGSTTDLSVRRPDGTVQYAWTHTSPQYYSFSYWYWYIDLPLNVASGEWTVEVVYQGVTSDHSFEYTSQACSCQPEYAQNSGSRLSGGLSFARDYQAAGVINSKQSISTTSTAVEVIYDAGESITLLPEFEVSSGVVFSALIGGCVL